MGVQGIVKAALVEPVLYPDGIRRLDLDTMKLL